MEPSESTCPAEVVVGGGGMEWSERSGASQSGGVAGGW